MKSIFPILLFLCTVFSVIAQHISKVRVSIQVRTDDTKEITPVMVCITNLDNLKVYTPPNGDTAEAPTFPAPFFNGITFSNNKNWRGPIRKMNGKGAVNGQRTYVYQDLPSLPYWSEPVMYQVSGDFYIDLFPGKWRISIEHGNEYIPIQQEWVIDGKQKRLTKHIQLKRWINLPAMGWYSGDVHTHHPMNKPSFKAYMMQMAKAEDLHLVNILEMGDRYTTSFEPEGFGPAHRTCYKNICLVPGQEEPRSDYGHIIGLNTAALARDTAHYNYYDLVFEKMHRHPDALVGYAHFAYKGEGVTKGMALYASGGAINFVELLQNGQINQEDYYDFLNIGFRIAAAAGSDFPWGSTIGDGRTFVYTGASFSADAWFAGLKAGHSFVSNGPALFLTADEKIPGEALHRTIGAHIPLHIKAFSNPAIGTIDSIALYNNDGLLFSQKNTSGADTLTVTINHTLKKSQWIVAAAYAVNGALAHTSAVYCIVDNEPIYNMEKAPAIIQKLQALIAQIAKEENEKPLPDVGILDRVKKAEIFYDDLLKRIKGK